MLRRRKTAVPPRGVDRGWMLFVHDGDIGVRGDGPTAALAFENVAKATAAIVDLSGLEPD